MSYQEPTPLRYGTRADKPSPARSPSPIKILPWRSGLAGARMPRSLRVQVQSLSVLPILGLAAVSISVSIVLTHQQVDAEASRNLREVAHLLATTTRDRSEALAAQTQLLAD